MIDNEYNRNGSNCYLHNLIHLITPITKYRKITHKFQFITVGLFFLLESVGKTFKIVLVEVIPNSCYIIKNMNCGWGHVIG